MLSIWYKILLSICIKVLEELAEFLFYGGVFFFVGIYLNVFLFFSILLEGR